MGERKTYSVTIFKRNGAIKTVPNALEEYDLGGVHCIVRDEFGPGGGLLTEKYPWSWIDHVTTEHRSHIGTDKPCEQGAESERARNAEIKRLRLQLDACSEAALANTRDIPVGVPLEYQSAAYHDVRAAVEREKEHREAREKAEARVKKLESREDRLAQALFDVVDACARGANEDGAQEAQSIARQALRA